jgi:hypothetical protein
MSSKNRNKPKYECEFCGEINLYTADDTVCEACDKMLLAEQKASDFIRAELWGQKHKCRKCDTALPQNRYFVCNYCVQDSDLPSEDLASELVIRPLDDESGPALFDRRKKATKAISEKCCSNCAVTKPVSEFKRHRGLRDGYQSSCKVCTNIANAKNEQKRRERLRAAKAKTTEEVA